MSQSIFKNPQVITPATLTPESVGNGTLTIDKLSHFTINANYSVICVSIDPITTFRVISDVDGSVGTAIVGQQFIDRDLKVFLTINQGPILFDIGDTFNFEVDNGTDLTQQNIDLYDELPQKNFGPGIVNQDVGDNNLRFSGLGSAAKLSIQDLEFESKLLGPQGNSISIEYIAGTQLSQAEKTIQDLTFQANIPGSIGNNISIEYIEFTPAVEASANIQDIFYDAITPGLAGNNISIEYTGGAIAGSEVVTVIGTAISVQIEDGVSSANDIGIALGLHPVAPTLVSGFPPGTGLEQQSIQPQTFLTGGAEAIGDAGNEIVTVLGQAIQVILESGVSTAQQVSDAITGEPAALALVTVTISGVANTVQTAPVAQTFLENGFEDVGNPGSEVVTVNSRAIAIQFVDGLSTAQQLKDAIEANTQADALVTVNLLGVGSEFQNSPVAEDFLDGGREDGTWSFNVNELTNPGDFFEGNGSILARDGTFQRNLFVRELSTFKGKATLDDQDAGNISGDPIDNAQKTINALIQNDKIFVGLENNSKVLWRSPDLTFPDNIIIYMQDTGRVNRILQSNSPITLSDGESIYVTLDRENDADLTHTIATTVPKTENTFRLVTRINDCLIFVDNTVLCENQSARIGSVVDFSQQILTLLEGANVAHSENTPGEVSWSAPLKVRPLGSTEEITIDPAMIQLADDEIAYVELDDPIVNSTKPMLKALRSDIDFALPDRFWIFHRFGNRILTRNGIAIDQGEERNIGESISEDLFAYIGSNGETDSDPDYTNIDALSTPPVNINDGDSLTLGLAKLDDRIQDVIGKVNDDRNLRLVRGGEWLWTLTSNELSFDGNAFVQVPSLTEGRNRILQTASPITLANDGDVAFIELNRDSGPDSDRPITVTSISTLVPTENTFIVAARLGDFVIVGKETLLQDTVPRLIGDDQKGGGGGLGTAIDPASGFQAALFNEINVPFNDANSNIDDTLSNGTFKQVTVDDIQKGFVELSCDPNRLGTSGSINDIDESQTLTFSAVPNAGNYRLTHESNETVDIPAGTNAAGLKAFLEALPSIDVGSLTVLGDEATGFQIGFGLTESGIDQDELIVSQNTLSINVVAPIGPGEIFRNTFSTLPPLTADHSIGAGITTFVGTATSNGSELVTNGGGAARWDAVSNFTTRTGCFRFKITPNFTGAAGFDVIFEARNPASDFITLQLQPSGVFTFQAFDNIGLGQITGNFGNAGLVSGVTDEFEFNYDFVSGQTRMFKNGIQLGATDTQTINQNPAFTVGAQFALGSTTSGALSVDAQFDDFQAFNAPQHTANFAGEIPRIVNGSSPVTVTPATSQDGVLGDPTVVTDTAPSFTVAPGDIIYAKDGFSLITSNVTPGSPLSGLNFVGGTFPKLGQAFELTQTKTIRRIGFGLSTNGTPSGTQLELAIVRDDSGNPSLNLPADEVVKGTVDAVTDKIGDLVFLEVDVTLPAGIYWIELRDPFGTHVDSFNTYTGFGFASGGRGAPFDPRRFDGVSWIQLALGGEWLNVVEESVSGLNEFRRVVSVVSPTEYEIDAAFSQTLNNASILVSQAVWLKDIVQLGDAAQETRFRDLFGTRTHDRIHISYKDSTALDDVVADFQKQASVVVAGSSFGLIDDVGFPLTTQFTDFFTRPEFPNELPQYPLDQNGERVFAVFFCNPNNGNIATLANLIEYKLSLYVDEEEFSGINGGVLDSGFIFSDSTSPNNIESILPVFDSVFGKTVSEITLSPNFNFIPGLNPGKSKGHIEVDVEEASDIPRFYSGLDLTKTLAYRELSPSTRKFRLSEDLSTGPLVSVHVKVKQNAIDSSEQNTAKLSGLNDLIVGTPAQVTLGQADLSSLQAAHDAIPGPGKIKLLVASITENVTWTNSQLILEGKGNASIIDGNLTIDGNKNTFRDFAITGNVIFNGNANEAVQAWQTPASTVTDNGTDNLFTFKDD